MGAPESRSIKTSGDGVPTSGYLSGHLVNTRSGGGYSRSRYAQQAWNTFGQFFPTDTSCRVLAIGPGDCEFEELLQSEMGYQNVEVVDIDAEVLHKASERNLTAHLTEDLASFLLENPATFDVIIMLHVLEHIPKLHTIPTLKAMRSALTSELGVALVEVPNMSDPFNASFMRYDDFTHEVGFTEHSLSYVLGQAGFHDIEFAEARGAVNPVVRIGQKLGRRAMKAMLMVFSLPNGRQMNRRVGPALSVRAK